MPRREHVEVDVPRDMTMPAAISKLAQTRMLPKAPPAFG